MQSWDFIAAIVAVLSAALLFGVVAARLRQDPIIGYLFAGIVIGPSVLDILKSGAALRDLSELGVALLLFTVGLEFSLNDLRRLGVVAWLGGILQVSATVAVTWLLLLAAGLNSTESLLIGMAVSMSSTAVVIRVLASRTELDSHHGRNALGRSSPFFD